MGLNSPWRFDSSRPHFGEWRRSFAGDRLIVVSRSVARFQASAVTSPENSFLDVWGKSDTLGGMSTVISNDDAKRIIARNVNRILKERGLSRRWLAQHTGEFDSTIANVCHGRKCCLAGLLARIAEALNVTLDDLLSPPRKKISKSRLTSTGIR